MKTFGKVKTTFLKLAGLLFAVGLSGSTLFAEPVAAARYDNQIQTTVTQKLSAKSEFRGVQSGVEDGIVTLTGTVDLYQRKLDAGKLVRKAAHVQGVRNLIDVAGPTVPDAVLEQKLAQKLRHVREGYDITFDYFGLNVKDGVVTVVGEDRTGVGRDEALADIQNTPGVKDVIDQITLEPVSLMDDGLRLRAARAIYRDSVLNKYAIDPAQPIRIIVNNGHITLYGSVDNEMDKNVAGLRANQLFGAFSVENKLVVGNDSSQAGM
jgi:hyperosmotically inducible periplasmic protein